jgi:GNAT superfamily N-acetyltransferase
MIVRLHNLSARAPVMEDVRAVTSLLVECDAVEFGIADPKEEDVQKVWQASDFNLKTDAWVIVSRDGQVVGYADVRHGEDEQLSFSIYVHPEYRSRGIGTLLIWMVEERARQMMRKRSSKGQATLNIAISSFNQAAQSLLEREGYVLARHFWRFLIEMDEAIFPESSNGSEKGKIRMDLVVDAQNLMGATPLARRTGMYVARQYHVYEKVLRVGHDLVELDQQEMQSAAV